MNVLLGKIFEEKPTRRYMKLFWVLQSFPCLGRPWTTVILYHQVVRLLLLFTMRTWSKAIKTNQFTFCRILWSRPIPLGWYFSPQWERLHGPRWPHHMCNNWLRTDRFLKNFASQIWVCPCTLEHALLDKGRFMPDLDCDRDTNPTCRYHWGGIHCVRSGGPR